MRPGAWLLALALVLGAAPAGAAERARSLVLFVGDGMGFATVAAARALAGRLRGEPGGDRPLAFERLPHTAIVRTASADALVPDSAAAMTALMTGVRTRNGLVAVGPGARRGDCAGARGRALRTLLEAAEAAGLATGVVTTTRVTHATPAAAYAHAPERGWESDADLPEAARRAGCTDIARQLVERPPGDGLEVVLGGGRAAFLPRDGGGRRLDGRDLVAAWRARHPDGAYVATRGALLAAARAGDARRVLGLFAPDHLAFEVDRPAGQPSLAEMTRAALAVLARHPRGHVLVVEAGRIDHGHHAGDAFRALTEVLALDEAVAAALEAVRLERTLVVVTADHASALAFAGWPARSSPLLGEAVELGPDGLPRPGRAADGQPYTVLGYATGPGPARGVRGRPGEPGFRLPARVPMAHGAHGGADVPLYAGGAGAARFHGAIAQAEVHRLLRAALGLDAPHAPHAPPDGPEGLPP